MIGEGRPFMAGGVELARSVMVFLRRLPRLEGDHARDRSTYLAAGPFAKSFILRFIFAKTIFTTYPVFCNSTPFREYCRRRLVNSGTDERWADRAGWSLSFPCARRLKAKVPA
jgi:hypothetical protein